MKFSPTWFLWPFLVTSVICVDLPPLEELKKMKRGEIKAFMSEGRLFDFCKAHPGVGFWKFLVSKGPYFLGLYNIQDILDLGVVDLSGPSSVNDSLHNLLMGLDMMQGWDTITFEDLAFAYETASSSNVVFDIGRLPWHKMELSVVESVFEMLPIMRPLQVFIRQGKAFLPGAPSNVQFFTKDLAEHIRSSESRLWMWFYPANENVIRGTYGEFMHLIYEESFSEAEKFLWKCLTMTDSEMAAYLESLEIVTFLGLFGKLPVYARHSITNRMISVAPELLKFYGTIDVDFVHHIFENYHLQSPPSKINMIKRVISLMLEEPAFFEVLAHMEDLLDTKVYAFIMKRFFKGLLWPVEKKYLLLKTLSKSPYFPEIMAEMAAKYEILDCSKTPKALRDLLYHYEKLVSHHIISLRSYDGFLDSLIELMIRKGTDEAQMILFLLDDQFTKPIRPFARNIYHVRALNRVITDCLDSGSLIVGDEILTPFVTEVGIVTDYSALYVKLTVTDIIIDPFIIEGSVPQFLANLNIPPSFIIIGHFSLQIFLHYLGGTGTDLTGSIMQELGSRVMSTEDDTFMDDLHLNIPSWNILRLAIALSRNRDNLPFVFEEYRERLQNDRFLLIGLLKLFEENYNKLNIVENLLRRQYITVSAFAEALYHLYETYPADRTQSNVSIFNYFYKPENVSDILAFCKESGGNISSAVFWYFKGVVRASVNPNQVVSIFSRYREELKESSVQLLSEINVIHLRLRYLLKKLAGDSKFETYIAPVNASTTGFSDEQEFRIICLEDILAEDQLSSEDIFSTAHFLMGEEEDFNVITDEGQLLVWTGSMVKSSITLKIMLQDINCFKTQTDIPILFPKHLVRLLGRYLNLELVDISDDLAALPMRDLLEFLRLMDYLDIQFLQ